VHTIDPHQVAEGLDHGGKIQISGLGPWGRFLDKNGTQARHKAAGNPREYSAKVLNARGRSQQAGPVEGRGGERMGSPSFRLTCVNDVGMDGNTAGTAAENVLFS